MSRRSMSHFYSSRSSYSRERDDFPPYSRRDDSPYSRRDDSPYSRRGTSKKRKLTTDDSTLQHANIMRSVMRDCSVREDLLQALPDELLLLCGTDFCNVCSKDISNDGVLMAHYSSLSHCKKMSAWVKDDCARRKVPIPKGVVINVTPLKPRELGCELCNEDFKSPEEAQNHYTGKTHKLVLREERMVKDPSLLVAPEGVHRTQRLRQREKIFFTDPDVPKTGDELFCSLCKVQTTTEAQLKQHQLGGAHRKKVEMKKKNTSLLEKIVSGVSDGGEDEVEDFTTEDFDTICSAYGENSPPPKISPSK